MLLFLLMEWMPAIVVEHEGLRVPHSGAIAEDIWRWKPAWLHVISSADGAVDEQYAAAMACCLNAAVQPLSPSC